ncbi:hypothetical protein PLCT2_01149 [Planctomycetaceae bacterium]|nr:hypothetical protein PLCT2_01149 [Planctomycetaceae bacterium]
MVLPEISGTDETVRIRVANSIVTRGEVSIPFWASDDKYTNVYVNEERGLTYGLWNIGQSLVLAPFLALSNPLKESMADPVGKTLVQGAVVSIGYALFVNVLLALATYGVLRQMRLSRRSSALGVLVLALCTQWLVWGMSLQEESLCALLLMAALWCGLRARTSAQPWRWGIAMGCLFGYLANVRFNGAFAAGAVLLWCAWMIPDRKRALMFAASVVLAALPWAALWLWYNWARTGDAFLSPYAANFAIMRRDLGMDTSWHFSYVRWAWMLVGLDNGAIWFALPLLFLPALRNRKPRPGGPGFQWLAVFMVVALLLHAVLLSGFYAGVGVQGAGSPRYLGHQLILFGPLVWVALRRVWLKKTRLARAGIATVLVASCVFQLSARLLNPELEASQDINFEHAGLDHPKPEHHLLRRFANVGTALIGTIQKRTYPQPRQFEPVTRARHTMLVATPSYLSFLRSHFSPMGEATHVIAWAAWSCCLAMFASCGGLLLRKSRKARPFPRPQSR